MKTVHSIDESGVIIHVDGAWLEFAQANGWRVREKEVVGRVIWDYLQGDMVRHVYRMLMQQAAGIDEPIVIPYRCDSPQLKRYMNMEILHQGGHFRFSNTLERVETIERGDAARAPIAKSSDLLSMCSWCKKVQTSAGQWLPVEHAVKDLGLFYDEQQTNISHGVCQSCYQSMMNPNAK